MYDDYCHNIIAILLHVNNNEEIKALRSWQTDHVVKAWKNKKKN